MKSTAADGIFSRRDKRKFQHLLQLLSNEVDPALTDFGVDRALDFFANVGNAARPILTADGQPLRWQNELIIDKISANASVLDLGCGDGELLANLINMKKVLGQGIEVNPQAVNECVQRGVPVLQTEIIAGLRNIPTQSYDFVILEETLQTLERPDVVMLEMLRVGRVGIISFPNFAFWQARLDFAVRGQMPRTPWLPYTWYNTPNIHNLSIQDFLVWAKSERVKIRESFVLSRGEIRALTAGDNLYAEEAVLLVERQSGKKRKA